MALVTPGDDLEASKQILYGLGRLLPEEEDLDGPSLLQRHPPLLQVSVHQPRVVKRPSIELEGKDGRLVIQLPAHARQQRHAARGGTRFGVFVGNTAPGCAMSTPCRTPRGSSNGMVYRWQGPRIGVGCQSSAVEARSCIGIWTPSSVVNADLANVEKQLVYTQPELGRKAEQGRCHCVILETRLEPRGSRDKRRRLVSMMHALLQRVRWRGQSQVGDWSVNCTIEAHGCLLEAIDRYSGGRAFCGTCFAFRGVPNI